VRKLSALILSAGLLLSLAACSSSASAAAGCSDVTGPGSASDSVSVTGDVGQSQTATFPFPLVADSAEVSTLVSTDDDDATVAGYGGVVNVGYTVYDGETGEAVGQPSTGLIPVSDNLPQALQDALACTSAGERVAVVLPNEDATTIISGATGTVVMVFDVTTAFPRSASGSPQPAQSGFPSVVRDETGRPGLTLTTTDAPTAAKAAVLIEGDGDEVAEGDALLVQVTSVDYSAPTKTAVNTWESGTPQLWLASDDATKTQGSEQPAGIGQYLIGQPIGSQVLVVLPGDDAGAAAAAWVVDILGVVPNPAG
jgi:peptidylprolyl isomerase